MTLSSEKWVGLVHRTEFRIPFRGPVSEVVNFLAHLFKEGYQYQSLNSYCMFSHLISA